MKRNLFLFVSFLFFPDLLFAQNVNDKAIAGEVADVVTKLFLKGTKVELLTMDSVLVDSCIAGDETKGYDDCYAFFVEKRDRFDGILRFSFDGYETLYKDVHQEFNKKRKIVYLLPKVYMKRKRKDIQLNGVTVRATQVKIYSHGDTLIYNADAFQMAEGSMLDALIKQLPGVELKDDGRILVNGRYVESLLLNGEDFFKNDRTVMLENLPSYMVKNIQVYEKGDRLDEMVGRNRPDKDLVMDVRLKRQYQVGWIANAEGGLGTKDRYLGRVFGLRFTPCSHLVVFANVNNVNESRKPGWSGDWTPSNMPTGLQAVKTIGIDFDTRKNDYKYVLSGNAMLSHTDQDSYQRTLTDNFLSGGQTWKRAAQQAYSCKTVFSASASGAYNVTNVLGIRFRPKLNYSRWSNRGDNASASWNADMEDWSHWADSLFSPKSNLLKSAVNYVRNRSYSSGHELTTGAELAYLGKVPGTDDWISLEATYNYTERDEKAFSHYKLAYPQSGAAGDYRNRYNRGRPNTEHNYSIDAEYTLTLNTKNAISAEYKIWQKFQDRDNLYYRLERLAGFGEADDSRLGMLPSERDALLSVLDGDNSTEKFYTETMNRPSLKWEFQSSQTVNKWEAKVFLPLRFNRKRIDYRQASVDTTFSRMSPFFEPELMLKRTWRDGNSNWTWKVSLSSMQPNLQSMIDVRHDSDPLNVDRGNPNLQNVHTYTTSFSYRRDTPSKGHFLTLYADYTLDLNKIAFGYVYDQMTGAYTYRPQNVNGNYNLYGMVNYTTPLDKAKRLTLNNSFNTTFQNQVDYVGQTGALRSERSSVRMLTMNETLKLDYKLSKVKLGLKLSGKWQHAESRRQGFSTINAGTCQYGLTGQFELPASWQFYTDLTMYSRRGYDDSSLNSDDFVWNARLSKQLFKKRFTLVLDGFDLLHQLSGVTHSLNGQARVETYRNVQPNYFMCRVIYRLNVKPKKRPGE